MKILIITVLSTIHALSLAAQAIGGNQSHHQGQVMPSLGILIIALLIIICIILSVLLVTRKRAKVVSNNLHNVNEQNRTLYQESRTILTALPVGIAIYDKNARQEYINDAVARIFGITDIEEHAAKHISLYDDPVLNDEIKDAIRQGVDIDTIVEYDLVKPTETSYFSTSLSHKMYIEGKVRYVKNNRGEIEKYILIMSDITEKRIQELELQRSELNLKLALETGGVDVWGYNIEKSAFYSIYGNMLTYDGASIEQVVEIMHEKCKDEFIKTMNALLSGEVKEASYVDRVINTIIHPIVKTKLAAS